MRIFLYALLAINVITLLVYGIDKLNSIKGKWRIAESTLLILAVFGGCLGAYIGMKLFRHKTKHWKFRIIVPICILIWIVVLAYVANPEYFMKFFQ